MDLTTILGSAGVTILLLAFALNLFHVLDENRPAYSLLNSIGAGLACYSSVLLKFMPFIILEGTWCVVAVISLIRILLKKAKSNKHYL